MKIKGVREIEIELNPQPKTSSRPSIRDKNRLIHLILLFCNWLIPDGSMVLPPIGKDHGVG